MRAKAHSALRLGTIHPGSPAPLPGLPPSALPAGAAPAHSALRLWHLHPRSPAPLPGLPADLPLQLFRAGAAPAHSVHRLGPVHPGSPALAARASRKTSPFSSSGRCGARLLSAATSGPFILNPPHRCQGFPLQIFRQVRRQVTQRIGSGTIHPVFCPPLPRASPFSSSGRCGASPLSTRLGPVHPESPAPLPGLAPSTLPAGTAPGHSAHRLGNLSTWIPAPPLPGLPPSDLPTGAAPAHSA